MAIGIGRRQFTSGMGAAAVGTLFAAAAHAPAWATDKIARVGVLTLNTSAEMVGRFAAFRKAMRELGYHENQNYLLKSRFADGKIDRLNALAAELVAANVDVVVTAGYPSIQAAKLSFKAIPIVVAIMSDPVQEGFAESYAHPGGNITGLAFQDAELTTKRLEVLKEVVPSLSHVAALWDPGMPPSLLKATQAAAHVLRLTLDVLPAGNATKIGKAFDAAHERKAQGLFQVSSPRFSALRDVIAASAIEKGMPAACEQRDFVAAGCLVSYGPSFDAMFGSAAYYVDKILKGARPADLPIEQPTKFDLVINLKTANRLGLTVAPTLLSRADEVIE